MAPPCLTTTSLLLMSLYREREIELGAPDYGRRDLPPAKPRSEASPSGPWGRRAKRA